MRTVCLCLLLVVIAACEPRPEAPPEAPAPEAISLLGEPLYVPDRAPEQQAALEAALAEARARYEADPDDVENIIWLGRRTAYLWRYREAIDIFS
ncbi:MAG: hypothetical protein D6746_09510, partial [Bacteroidetes bacterium]